MSPSARRLSAVVTIAVLSGIVEFRIGQFAFKPWESVALGEEEEGRKTTGTVIAAGEGILKLKVGGETVTFQVGEGANRLARHEVSQLNLGDVVTVHWVAEHDRKFVRDVSGKGALVGTVAGTGDNWIEITPDGGRTQRFLARWIGGMPHDGGGPEKEMVKLISKQKVGSKVELTWDLVEGKRVVGIKSAE